MKRRRSFPLQPILWLLFLCLTAAGAAWAWKTFDVGAWQRLDVTRLTAVAQKGAILDRNGDPVTTLVGRENRTVIDASALPAHVRNAFLAAESEGTGADVRQGGVGGDAADGGAHLEGVVTQPFQPLGEGDLPQGGTLQEGRRADGCK